MRARRRKAGIGAGFDDAQWSPCSGDGWSRRRAAAGTGTSHPRDAHVHTDHRTEPKPGVLVYDLGQNFAGWPEITVSGPAGAVVKLIPR